MEEKQVSRGIYSQCTIAVAVTSGTLERESFKVISFTLKKNFFFFVKWLYCILSNISLSHMVSLNWKVTLKLSFHMIIMNLASKLCSWASHYLQTCFIGKTKKNQKGCRLKKNSEEFFMKKLKWGFSCFSFC